MGCSLKCRFSLFCWLVVVGIASSWWLSFCPVEAAGGSKERMQNGDDGSHKSILGNVSPHQKVAKSPKAQQSVDNSSSMPSLTVGKTGSSGRDGGPQKRKRNGDDGGHIKSIRRSPIPPRKVAKYTEESLKVQQSVENSSSMSPLTNGKTGSSDRDVSDRDGQQTGNVHKLSVRRGSASQAHKANVSVVDSNSAAKKPFETSAYEYALKDSRWPLPVIHENVPQYESDITSGNWKIMVSAEGLHCMMRCMIRWGTETDMTFDNGISFAVERTEQNPKIIYAVRMHGDHEMYPTGNPLYTFNDKDGFTYDRDNGQYSYVLADVHDMYYHPTSTSVLGRASSETFEVLADPYGGQRPTQITIVKQKVILPLTENQPIAFAQSSKSVAEKPNVTSAYKYAVKYFAVADGPWCLGATLEHLPQYESDITSGNWKIMVVARGLRYMIKWGTKTDMEKDNGFSLAVKQTKQGPKFIYAVRMFSTSPKGEDPVYIAKQRDGFIYNRKYKQYRYVCQISADRFVFPEEFSMATYEAHTVLNDRYRGQIPEILIVKQRVASFLEKYPKQSVCEKLQTVHAVPSVYGGRSVYEYLKPAMDGNRDGLFYHWQ